MSTTNHDHHIYVLMGVSGSGKSAVASEVAHQLHAAFLDGDFLHPRRNIEKMASGEPLNDDDRKPWLQALNDAGFWLFGKFTGATEAETLKTWTMMETILGTV
ncbi:hypothetical protein MMS54_18225, partial [Escherichia coli]